MKRADHHLVQKVLDGDVSQEGFDDFQKRLRNEPDLLKLYGDYALLQHSLSEELEGGRFTESVPTASRGLLGPPLWLMAVFVCALTAALVWFRPWTGVNPVDNVAAVTFSVDAVWQFDGATRNLGAATGVAAGGNLKLSQGRASVSLEPSVTALIEGPAELKILSRGALHLVSGSGFFRCGGAAGVLKVTTDKLGAVDSGTEFGVVASSDSSDELHVRSGKVRVASTASGESISLTAVEAVKVPEAGGIERIAANDRRFATGLGRFRVIDAGLFEKDRWRIAYGNPSFNGKQIDGANYSAFLKFPEPLPANPESVLLVTLDVGKPTEGEFHTDGWAGMSFFSGGNEVLFFGDSFGTKSTWSLDVKQRMPVILPAQPVLGPRTVTLRYDAKSGLVSLHDGEVPLKPPFCQGKLPVGLMFDEVRLGASAGAALSVHSLRVREGGG